MLRCFVNRIVFVSMCLSLLLKIPGGLLQAEVALLIGPTGTKTDADKGGPRSALE